MKTIILGTAHLKSTPGKCSPDKKFFEYLYSREVCKEVKTILESMGYKVFIDIEDDDLPLTQSKELALRCKIVNDLQKKYGNCIYISIHVNGAGDGSKWMNATGFEVYSSIGKTQGDVLAKCINDAAIKTLTGKRIRGTKEANFYVLKHTICPAVLTENFFQDSKSDVEYLQSDLGFYQIVKTHVDGIINFIKDN